MNDWNDPEFRKEYDRKRFQNNKEKRNSQNRARYSRIKKQVDDLKSSSGCSRCPEKNPVCLDFHHLDPSVKEIEIGNAYRLGWSFEKMQEEISKCIILCANCHLKEHYIA